ncbi:MAG: hypothetical protein AAF408_16920, partial [Pseudomonadota bacterium]
MYRASKTATAWTVVTKKIGTRRLLQHRWPRGLAQHSERHTGSVHWSVVQRMQAVLVLLMHAKSGGGAGREIQFKFFGDENRDHCKAKARREKSHLKVRLKTLKWLCSNVLP